VSLARRLLAPALVVLLAVAALLARPAPARAANDPDLAWYSIETPHFRITYHSGLEELAQHVANVAEGISDTMELHMGWQTRERTELLLADYSEAANGSATALPYNAMRLLVTAPEDMSALGDVDDWYLTLVTHEHTHILHTDNIRGIPAIVNRVLGKTLAPNQVQPRWILEGLGVYHESARTSAGRLRNSLWDMYMRTDVLESNVASIDQVTAFVRRWPQGNLFYLYGSFFTQWIAETYGEEALRKAAADYGKNPIPWGFNRSIRRATGKTYVELYPEWVSSMQKRYGAQASAVRAKGVREGVRLTHHGQLARYPRWIPKGAWPEHQGGLLYFRDDQRLRPGLWALPLTRDAKGQIVSADEKRTEHIARAAGESYASFMPDGSVVFGSQDYFKNVFLFSTLEKMAPGARSSFGPPDGGRSRLTEPAQRASDPAVSPDGRRVVFTVNRHGTRTLHIGDLEGDRVTGSRMLVRSTRMEQAFTPRWSPDGRYVAYSVWQNGGYRDVRIVDVRDGSYQNVTSDRAVDGGPSFSPDGKHLFFHSDRTGIMNLYAFERSSQQLFQVSNVLTGAYAPEPSPDGKTLAYVGYTKAGFDLFAMPLDPASWTEAEPYVDPRPPVPRIERRRYPVKPYSPWPTLEPRRYGVQIAPGNFGGQAVTMSVAATDITGFHSISGTTVTELERPELQGTVGYTYGRLPFNLSVSAFRRVTPRGGFQIGEYRPTVAQENTGFASTLAYPRPRAFDAHYFAITHAVSRVGANYPFPTERLDPYETPVLPPRGLASTLRLGYYYTNAERYLWSVAPERGYSLGASIDVTDPALGSEFAGFVANADVTTYWMMPWLRHHSLALHGGTGTSGGNYPGRGAFFVGGFVDLPLVDTVRDVLIQGGITLRGYPSVALAGRSYLLANAEYRFPIVNLDRGPSTLPLFLNRINGAVFFDYGSAFEDFQTAQFKSGTGGELWFDFTLGYVAQFTFRLGYARGLASLGVDKAYWVAAVPF
jgi:Tol biopolymer transport system component